MNSTLVEDAQLSGASLAPEVYSAIPPGPQVGLAAATKRLLDIAGALAALVIFGPVMILVTVAIVLGSGWPPLFLQRRVGFGGQVFTVCKFRSMVKDAEKSLAELRGLNEVTDGPIFKIRKDPRLTRVGTLLRRTSMDELPQLLNVLIGNMSLVGPRPALESEVLQYEPWQLARLAVKPGLTGLWQVSGRSDLGFGEMVGLDIRYVEQWSVWQDVVLLARTPAALITARGAY
jgi:lipopolysaccharide/colanic/teichoic acid biosynthesis glycosyltransferase